MEEEEMENVKAGMHMTYDQAKVFHKFNETKHNKPEELDEEELDLSVRAYNCLKRDAIHTLQDLTSKSESEMMKIRNLGKKSLKEVLDKVKDMGLKFRDED